MSKHETDRPGPPELGEERVAALYATITARLDTEDRARRRRRLAVAAASVAVVVGGVATTGYDRVSGPGGVSASSGADVARETAEPVEPSSGPADASAVEVRASARVVTDDPSGAADLLTSWAERSGGRTTSRSVQGDAGTESVDLALRVRADDVDELRAQLDRSGDVSSLQVSSTDVGGRRAELAERRDRERAVVRRLREIARTAEDTSELLAAEAELAERQAALEATAAELAALDDRVALAAVDVSLVSPGTDGPGPLERARDAFADGLGGAVWLLGLALPWVLLVAVGLGAARLAGLAWRRRRV